MAGDETYSADTGASRCEVERFESAEAAQQAVESNWGSRPLDEANMLQLCKVFGLTVLDRETVERIRMHAKHSSVLGVKAFARDLLERIGVVK